MNDLPLDLVQQLAPAHVTAVGDALCAFPAHVVARGEDYALAGRVIEETLEPGVLRARVRGSRIYAVRWTFGEHGADPLCSCPAGPVCKHAYAVGLRLVAAALELHHTLEPRHRRLLPLVWRRERPQPPASLTRAARGAAEEKESPRLRALRHANEPWLRLTALRHLLTGLAVVETSAISGLVQELAYEEDPDVLCWRLAQALASQREGQVPKLLEPWFAREDLAQRAAERARRQVVERLSSWATAESQQRHLRVVLGLERDAQGDVRVTVQARLTSPKLQDEPRSSSHLAQLAAELRHDPRALSPPQARLLRLLTAPEMHGVFDEARRPRSLANAQLNLLLDRAAGSPFVSWSDALPAELAVRAGVTPGARADLAGDDLRMTLECRATGDDLLLGLALAALGNAARPLAAALAWPPEHGSSTTHATIVLFEGRFHRVIEEPPPDIVRLIGELHGVPLRREDGALLDQLAARFESVAAALGEMTRTYDARAVVTLELRPSDWVHVRVFAHTAPTAWRPGDAVDAEDRVFEHTPLAGWQRIATETLAPAGEDAALPLAELVPDDAPERGATGPHVPWRERPAPERVATALAWLQQLGATRGDRRGPGGIPPEVDAANGWWLRLNARTAALLEQAWRERPHDVAWYGNRAAHDLLAGRRRVRARVSVVATGVDWLAVRAEWESEGLALTEADLAKLRASTDEFVRLSGGWVRRDEAGDHDLLGGALADLGIEANGREQRLPLWQLAQASEASLAMLAGVGADEDTLAAVAQIRAALATFAGVPRVELPSGLAATLRPYQRDGLDFLAWCSALSTGAVLADDMGLGKTVQALAWLLHLRDAAPDGGPALVVCPASVAHNWAREAARFAPTLRVLVLASGRERRAQLRTVTQYDLVITNYALLRRDVAHWREVPLRALVLDEAQNVKNPDAAVARAALELHAQHRLALTGTPLENRALDLWSILAIVQPGHLGPRARFVERYDRPDAPPHVRRLLAARLRPVMLRRLKAQVERDLPARIEERLDCTMTPGQRKLYVGELVRARRQLGALGDSGGVGQQRIVILTVLTRLRQICCHPALVGGDATLGSGKLDALFELLEPLRAEGQKVLVFSQFVRCLDLIGAAMRRRGLPFHVLTGATSTKQREKVVQAFTEDVEPSTFLVSLKAGGTGLNLTAANHVVLFDPWWNPAVEAQAIDRTHRIGQTRSVVAYRLYAEGTIEERIAELQSRKAALVRDVLGEDGFARTLTRADLDFLLAD